MATANVEQPHTSLRDLVAFPPFLSCPHEARALVISRESVTASRWCFLGEIKEIFGLGRLGLDVKDKDNHTVRMYFYLDRLSPSVVEIAINDPGGVTFPPHPNLPRHLIQRGHTIAVLYAEQHPWKMEPSTGIRIEDGNMVQIFPCSLDKLLSLSDRILQSISQNNVSEPKSRTCEFCGEKAAPLRCAACHLACYCKKDCQTADWSDEGHKKSCKLAAQATLLMNQSWDSIESQKSLKFPLSKRS